MQAFEGIEEFVEVVLSGSFTAAADGLGVSKSHISKQVSRLEERLGAPLLLRTTRKLALTEIGKRFFARCHQITTEMMEAQSEVSEFQGVPRGKLRITTAGIYGEEILTRAAASFMQANPHVEIEIYFTNRVVDLLEEGFDMAIRMAPLMASSLISRKIASRRVLVCASPGFVERYGVPDEPEDLRHFECLAGTTSTWRFHKDGRTVDHHVEGRFSANNARSVAIAARAGLGLARLPYPYFARDLNKGNIVQVLEDWEERENIWAVFPRNRQLSTKLRAFLDHLVDHWRWHEQESWPSF